MYERLTNEAANGRISSELINEMGEYVSQAIRNGTTTIEEIATQQRNAKQRMKDCTLFPGMTPLMIARFQLRERAKIRALQNGLILSKMKGDPPKDIPDEYPNPQPEPPAPYPPDEY